VSSADIATCPAHVTARSAVRAGIQTRMDARASSNSLTSQQVTSLKRRNDESALSMA
jgi:hypothetical protein